MSKNLNFETCNQHRLLALGANQLLMAASIGDDNEIKRLLVKEGISVNQEFKHGLTALHEACDAERLSTVQLLIEQKANINKQVTLIATQAIK